MLILIGIVPAYFALNSSVSPASLEKNAQQIELLMNKINPSPLSKPDQIRLDSTQALNRDLIDRMGRASSVSAIPKEERFLVRKDIMLISTNLKYLMDKEEVSLSEADKKKLTSEITTIKTITDYSPRWVIVMIAASLSLGTMIGWKRIVKTIGEKIGKEHLSYAQGASAEMVAATTIGLSTSFGLPVSTTHVLSSGIAGSMVASKGVKNLQPDTVRNILIAWLLTLPVVMLMSGTLFLIFRSI
jgi:phosphate/sulfate permease